MYGSQRNAVIAAVVVLAIIAIAALVAANSRRKGGNFNSSFQFWTRDPASGSPPSMNPHAPRSQLLRDNSRRIDPRAGLSDPLQVSAAFTPSPADNAAESAEIVDDLEGALAGEGFRGPRRWRRRWGHRHASPLWFAGPMARYAWGNAPLLRVATQQTNRNGPTPSWYGSVPYYATW